MFRLSIVIVGILALSGCTTIQIPNYIQANNPYIRKMYGDFDQVAQATKTVLAKYGWQIDKEVDPSVYERDSRYDNNPAKNLLIFTNLKQRSLVLTSSYTHLNVFLHSVGTATEVEVRYHSMMPVIKRFVSTRNDKLANRILDAIEQQLNGG